MTQDPDIAVKRSGQAGEPPVIIDNFFADTEALHSAARTAAFVPARNAYPGLRAPLPQSYWSDDQLQLMSCAIEWSFGLAGSINFIDASLSMITL